MGAGLPAPSFKDFDFDEAISNLDDFDRRAHRPFADVDRRLESYTMTKRIFLALVLMGAAGAWGANHYIRAGAAVSVVYTAAHKAGLVVLPSGLPNGVDYILAIYNEGTGSNTDEAVDLVRFVKEDSGFTFYGSIVTNWKS